MAFYLSPALLKGNRFITRTLTQKHTDEPDAHGSFSPVWFTKLHRNQLVPDVSCNKFTSWSVCQLKQLHLPALITHTGNLHHDLGSDTWFAVITFDDDTVFKVPSLLHRISSSNWEKITTSATHEAENKLLLLRSWLSLPLLHSLNLNFYSNSPRVINALPRPHNHTAC